MKPFPARSPVFVDSTGRRHRSIRRAGALLAVPAVGYLVLLASSLLGGPRVDTPLIPLPEAAKHVPGPGARVTQVPVRAAESPKPDETVRTTTDPSTTPSDGPTTPPSPTPTASLGPSSPTSSVTPTSTPAPPRATPDHGKPTAPPGRTKSPKP